MLGEKKLWTLGMILLLTAACGPASEEERIRNYMKAVAASAEDKDLSRLMGYFAPEYIDFEGRDKAATESLIQSYLSRYRGIVIHILSTQIDSSESSAGLQVQVEAVLSSGAAQVLRKLIRFGGEYYRFRLKLRQEGPRSWLIESAAWKSVSVGELLPESLEVLRKLFPDE